MSLSVLIDSLTGICRGALSQIDQNEMRFGVLWEQIPPRHSLNSQDNRPGNLETLFHNYRLPDFGVKYNNDEITFMIMIFYFKIKRK